MTYCPLSARLTSLVASLVLVSLPFLAVYFAPITDLPQQVSQIRLLIDSFTNRDNTPYLIQWVKPGNLSYFLLGVCWIFFDPPTAGRIAMMITAFFWVIAIHFVSWRRDSPPEAPVLATLFIFNQSLYWGFYNFMLGMPAFVLWFQKTTSTTDKECSAREAAINLGYGILLYSCHILWFLGGIVWLVFQGLAFFRSFKATLFRVMCQAPVILLTIYWYLDFSGTEMASQSALRVEASQGFFFAVWLVESAFGGIKGPIEYWIFLALSAWIAAAIISNRQELKSRIDWPLFSAGALFFFGAFLLPDIFMTTVLFNARWIPVGLVLVMLSLPPNPLRHRLRITMAVVLLAGLSGVTTLSWIDFDKKETSGLVDTLNALPNSVRVVGLATIQSSRLIKGQPSLHMFAYAQAFRGCSLNFSFANFPSSLVTFSDKSKKPWTEHVEWFPERLKVSDLLYFDYVIADGLEDFHAGMAYQPYFKPVTTEGRWRLYKIIHESIPLENAGEGTLKR